MGQASNRGTREERVAQAIAAGRTKTKPERTKPYRLPPRQSTKALDALWRQYKVFGDVTVGEIHAAAVAEQKRLAAERAAREQTDANNEMSRNDDERISREGVVDAGTTDYAVEAIPDWFTPQSRGATSGPTAA